MEKSLFLTGLRPFKWGMVFMGIMLAVGCGGGSSGGGTTASSDTTPTAFTFTDQTGVAKSTEVTSAAITVVGIDAAAAISITGGTYQIGSGSFTSSAGTVTNGQTVKVKHTSSSSGGTAVNTVLTIGGVSDTFTSTTVADPVSGIALPSEIDIVETS